MMEVELKARLRDKQQLERKLGELGFAFTNSTTESDTYYSGVDRDFAVTDEALRTRRTSSPERTLLTYKGPKLDSAARMRAEYETEVADAATLRSILNALGHKEVRSILNALGHKEVRSVVKRRSYYALGSVTVCVDSVEGLGDYVELERLADEASASEAAEELVALLGKLGLSKADCTRKSYLELLLEKDAAPHA